MNSKIVEYENVSIFQNGKLILTDISLKVNKGEFVFLIGRTGSGKSSLIRTLYGDLKLNKGKGRIVSFSLNKLKNKEIPYLRRKIGVVFQDFKLLTDRDIYKNLEFVLKATGWKEKKKIGAALEIKKYKKKLKNK